MKKYLALCMVALLTTVSGFSYEIISSTNDRVIFKYDCYENSNCMSPGLEYCGENQVNTVLCVDKERCDVNCKPIVTKSVTTKWTATFTVMPVEKVTGQPFMLTVKDTRNGKPVVCDVEIYYGGRWDVTQSSGASHLAGTMAVVRDFTDSKYVDGQLIESTHTERQGTLVFTPDKPGFYVLRLLNKYVAFPVGDASGSIYECGNDECETALGEDETVCPDDCEQSSTVVQPAVCGDGTCAATEDAQSCPQDCQAQLACVTEGNSVPVIPNAPPCCEGLSAINCAQPDASGNCPPGCLGASVCGNCGNGVCGPGENKCNCPQDCGAKGADMTMLVIIIAIIAVVVILGLVMMKSKGPKKPKAAKSAPPAPNKCPNCGADLPTGSAFCQVCGTRI